MKAKTYLSISLISLLIFLALAILIPQTSTLDKSLNAQITKIQTSVFTEIMILMTNLADALAIVILTLIVISALIYHKRYKHSKLFILSILASYILGFLAKILINRPRPVNALITELDSSFPSGHAIRAIIFFGLLIFLFKDNIKNKAQKLLFIKTNIFLILLIGFSRLYLGVHYFTDVLAGYALGLFILMFSIYLIEK